MRVATLFRAALVLVLLIAFAGCAPERRASVGNYKVGTPYQINGVWYYPKEDPFYDETGIASWYGSDFHGKSTANGERYDMSTMTAAHRTLPMPSIVRVTNLENGRSIRLRVNDRGPYARGRIIDLSRRAAELLGFQNKGTARVRVQYEGRGDVGGRAPSEEVVAAKPSDLKAAPLSGVSSTELAPPSGASAAPARTAAALPTPSGSTMAPVSDNEPDGTVTMQPVPAKTQLWVQVGAFQSRANADRLAERMTSLGYAQVSTTTASGRPLHRVRFGPIATVEQADAMLDKVIGAGHNGAQIVVD
jgi:rare lipoprotein A